MPGHRLFFGLAVRNLRLHWVRSMLAIIGIVIGVIAISSMGILGSSLVLSVSDSLTSVGDSIVVTPHASFQGMGASSTNSRITDRQVELIRKAAPSNDVIPIYSGGEKIKLGKEDSVAGIYGIAIKDIPVLLDLKEGQYLRSSSGVMVGSKIAYDNNLSIGSRIMIGEEEVGVRVTGVLKERGMGFDINPDHAIVTSDQWYKDQFKTEGYDLVIVKVKDLTQIEKIKDAIDAQLNRKETEVNVYDTKAILETILTTFGRISTFTMAIGGISLIVAGVSILNVMMMSVMERTKEIGILRSIGTRRSHVLSMFIFESLILGLIGSIIGGLLSFIGGYLVILVMLQDTKYLFAFPSLIQIPYGMLFGVATSLLSGLYPAWKASNMNPIDALRHE